MRKIAGGVLLALGVLLVVVGLVAKFWATDHVTKVPLDTNSTTHLTGQARVLDPKTGKVAPTPVRAANITKIDANRSDDTNAVWTSVSCLVKPQAQGPCGRRGTGKHADPNVVSNSAPSVFVTDRTTGIAPRDQEKYLPAGVISSVDGRALVNKLPFHAQKKTYPYWEGTLGKVVPLRFVGTATLHGLQVYKYRYTVTNQPTQIAANTPGTYSMDQVTYADPVTGAQLSQTQHQIRKTMSGDTVADISLAFTPAQVAANVKDAKANGAQLKLVTKTLPLVGWVAGIPLMLIGLALVLLGGRRSRRTTSASGEQRDGVHAHA